MDSPPSILSIARTAGGDKDKKPDSESNRVEGVRPTDYKKWFGLFLFHFGVTLFALCVANVLFGFFT